MEEMTGAQQDNAMRSLCEEFQRIRIRIPGSRWFFFGSVTNTSSPVRDIDLLVVCDTADDCTAARAELASICARFPIHLLLMSKDEEAEAGFIKRQIAVEIALESSLC